MKLIDTIDILLTDKQQDLIEMNCLAGSSTHTYLTHA